MELAGLLIVLFIVSFLAPSPIPVPTDAYALAVLLAKGSPFSVLIVLIVGHLLGLLVFYILGLKTGKHLATYEKRKKDKAYVFAQKMYKNYGKYSLIFGQVPVLGKPLVTIAGVFGLGVAQVVLWYMGSKIVWYVTLIFMISYV